MDDVTRARQVLHAVAEYLLAGPQWRATGEIALAVTGSGFSTTASPAPGITNLAVRGHEVVAEPAGTTLTIGGSIRAMATALGIAPGPPDGLYDDHATLGVDDPLPAATDIGQSISVILTALIDGAAALGALDASQPPILWPEHFDVGISMGAVNYGVSPGDASHVQPYAYVGPVAPRTGDFWNESFGASCPVADLGGAPGILGFFVQGRRLVEQPGPS